MGHAEHCGYLVDKLGGIHGQGLPVACGHPDGVCDTVCRLHNPVICSKPWLLLSQPLTAPRWCSSGLSPLDDTREKWASLAAFHRGGECRQSLTCSYFPQWEKSRAEKGSLGIELCCLGRAVTDKSNCASYSLECIQTYNFFLFQGEPELLHQTHRLSKGSLVCG